MHCDVCCLWSCLTFVMSDNRTCKTNRADCKDTCPLFQRTSLASEITFLDIIAPSLSLSLYPLSPRSSTHIVHHRWWWCVRHRRPPPTPSLLLTDILRHTNTYLHCRDVLTQHVNVNLVCNTKTPP
jgi:hypothetical protein